MTQKGSLAAYWSDREAREESPLPDGEGSTWLFSYTFSRLRLESAKRKVTEIGNLRLQIGGGSGDDPSTAEVDEGYMGETASFAPDNLFLSRFAGKLSTEMMEESQGQVGAALANKRYLGLTLTDNRYSLLAILKRRLGLEADIISKKTIYRYHRYSFEEDVFGSGDAGEEFSIEFQMQAPKDVNLSLGAAMFSPGRALRQVITEDAWSVFGSISVTI